MILSCCTLRSRNLGWTVFSAIIAAFLAGAGPVSASLISAHTDGSISRTSPIQVQFSRTMAATGAVDKPLDPSPFSFRPKIKGKAAWRDSRTLVFTPDQWLPPEQKYKAVLDLGAIMPDPPQGEFTFGFATRPQAFQVDLDGFKSADPRDLDQLELAGTVNTADAAEDKAVEAMLTAKQGDRRITVRWTHDPNRRRSGFTLSGIRKEDAVSTLSLRWDGAPVQARQAFTTTLEVPAGGPFSVLEARPLPAPERAIELIFSDPPDPDQALDGLIRLAAPDGARLRFSVGGNRVRVYSSRELSGEQTLLLDTGIRSAGGGHLAAARRLTVRFEDLKPRVRFVGERTIIPTTRGYTIPIETANLRAVVVTVIHVPADNLAQFLQVNALDGGQELNRVGRPVLRRVIPLSFQPDQRNRWVRHGLDVGPLIAKRSGGLLRLELSFLPEYMVVDCPGRPAAGPAVIEAEDLPLTGDWNRQREKSAWDNYEDGGSGLPWHVLYENRENPCHPGYFSTYDDHDITATRNVLISDIGLIAKQGQDDTVMVAVTDLKSAKPLADADLTLLDYQQQVLATGRSGADGLARLKAGGKPFLLVARHTRGSQTQFAYLKMDDGSALVVSHFDTAGRTVRQGLKGFLYGERGVWRPGDDMFLTFILNDPDGRLPAGHPVIFELRDPKGRLADRIVAREGQNGFYAFKTGTPADAPTGNWLAKVKVGGTEFSKTLKVETVQPNRLKIQLDLGSGKALYSGGESQGRIGGSLKAMWLHGAVARQLKADIKLSFHERPTRFAGLEDYVFDDPTRRFSGEPQLLFDGRLDDQGLARFDEKFSLEGEAPGMLTAAFETRVFEPGGAFSIDSASMPFHPYARYVGLLTPKGDAARGMLLTDTEHTVRLAMVDDHGRPVPQGEVEIKLFKIKWRWWWEKAREDFADFNSSHSYRLIKEDRVAVINGKGQWHFRINYPEWGRYMIRVTDRNGRHAAGKIIYIDWPGWAGRGQKDIPGAATVLSFSADKPAYKVGENVTLTIPATPQGRGLLSIENGTRVLSARWIESSGDTVRHTFTATADMAPNVYAHVTFIQPHQQTLNDRPLRMYGVIPIAVEDPGTRLQPVIEASAEFEPESTAGIVVREQQGRPMTYTLAVVDEGLLSLTRFKTPDPWDHFFQREALGVRTWDLFDHVAGAYSGLLEQLLAVGGGDAGKARGSRKANRFPPVVRFLGPFNLAAGAADRHSVDIPRYVGQVRVMVTAGRQGAYGAADRQVFVRKPLMLLGTLPRVISVGETVRLPVSVFALDPGIRAADVNVQVRGAASIPENVTAQAVQFSGPGDVLTFFNLQAADRPGTVQVDLAARSNDLTARQSMAVDVRLPSRPITDSIGAELKPGDTWQQEVVFPGLAGTNQVTLELSRIPPLNLAQRLDELIRYPHGCVEQTTSAAFPQLYLDRLVELPPDRLAAVQTHVSAAVARLAQFQTSAGGFSYWPGGEEANNWATCYAGHFLLEARNHGYLVQDEVLSRWRKFQRRRADAWEPGDTPRGDLVQAYRLYTLALAGSPSLSAMNRLRERSSVSSAARWRLAAAYQMAGQTQAAAELVQRASLAVAPYSELSGTFGSDLRDKAMILETLLLMDRPAETYSLVRDISAELSGKHWLSTQSTAYALLAMARAAGDLASDSIDAGYTWNAAPEASVTSTRPMVQQTLPAGDTTSGHIALRNQGKGVLYARLAARGLPEPGREKAAADGLKLDVRYLDGENNELDVDALEQGIDFIAEISVTHTGHGQDYRELALSHLVPSGWEIHNARLSGTDDNQSDAFTWQDIRDDRVYTYFDLKRGRTKTFRIGLTAAYEGRFYLPMIGVEAMYDAAIHARVPGRWVEVKAAGR